MTTRGPGFDKSGSPNILNKASIKARTGDNKFQTPQQYLDAITTGLNLEIDINLQSIVKALSNKYMSVLLIKIESSSLQKLYGNNRVLLRCYNNRTKFFEMPLNHTPLFIDIFGSTIAYIMEGEDNKNKIYAIDVGKFENSKREIDETTEGQAQPTEFEHEFEEDIIGFKLGHFMNGAYGNMKAVMWSQKKVYMFPFNPDTEKQEDSENKKFIYNSRDLVEIDGIDEDDIERILDFGVNTTSNVIEEYDDEKPEALLLVDTEGTIHILKGEVWGKTFSKHIEYPKDVDEPHWEIRELHDMVLISTFKLVGIIEKTLEGRDEYLSYLQVFEFDMKDDYNTLPKMTREYYVLDVDVAKDNIRNNLIVDDLNKLFLFSDGSANKEVMHMLPITNNVSSKAESLDLNTQVAMNIVANNVMFNDSPPEKTKGLIYKDFCCADNLLVMLHGKVITCFDLMDKTKKPSHITLNSNQSDNFYDFGEEPVAVWMMDKTSKNTDRRWKIIVAFRNGEVKEVAYDSRKSSNNLTLKDYLQNIDRRSIKIPGTIVKVMRNRNDSNVPVYFVVKSDMLKKNVLATIEFQSQTYREYDIQGTNSDNTKYIVLDIKDKEQRWQELAAVVTNADPQNDLLEQKLIHFKIRIGPFEIAKSKEIAIINREDLQQDMENVQHAQDVFYSKGFIYFVHKNHVDKYNLDDNSHTKVQTGENILKLLSFDNKFYYWRTVLGGFNDNRYITKIYFDGLDSFSNLGAQSQNQDVKIFQGLYPHSNKLQFDSMSESIACFTSFYEMKVFPLLHLPRIKVKVEGNRETDSHIIATKYLKPSTLLTVHNNNTVRSWNLKTGKFALQERALLDNEDDLSEYVFHQRITDSLTLLRSYKPLFATAEDAAGQLPPKHDQTHEVNNIAMYKYKIIMFGGKVEFAAQAFAGQIGNVFAENMQVKLADKDLAAMRVVTIKSFIGPHAQNTINFGLYAGNDYDLFAFFFKDSQEKLQLHYFRISDVLVHKDVELNGEFFYLEKIAVADQERAKLSIHSPNFQALVIDQGLKEYSIYDYKFEYELFKLPQNLNNHTVEVPNFLTNEQLLFMTEDKIIKSFDYVKKQEEFIVSHCDFPGSTDKINLATLLKVGNHIIGENTLTYERIVKLPSNGKPERLEERIAPNNFNYFFLEALKEHEASEDYNELKIIQCHYKNKLELSKRSIFGYFFTQSEYDSGAVSTQLYVTSTYSYYHWRIIELMKEKKLNVANLNDETLRNLSYVQLPDGSTLLHQLATNRTALEQVYKKVQYKEEDRLFHIPLLKDRKGFTAIDYALNKATIQEEAARSGYLDIFKRGNSSPSINKAKSTLYETELVPSAEAQSEVINKKTAELILKHIGLYPFDLFKVRIKNLIDFMIEQNLIEFADFMENSAKTPSFLEGYDRAKIEVIEECGSYVFTASDVWSHDETAFKALFNQEKEDVDEKLISMKILDIPEIHHYLNSEDNKIYQRLSEVDDPAIFEKTSIKALIEQKWLLTQTYIKNWLLYPYLALLLVFTYFTINDLESDDTVKRLDEGNKYANALYQAIFCRVCIVAGVTYFFIIEIKQCTREGFVKHISDFWNYLDIVPPILIAICEIMNLTNDSGKVDDIVRTLYSFTALAMWLRFLYFFRVIRSTGFYIRMIVEVIIDMAQFFFIFFITVIAFGHTTFIFQLTTFAQEEGKDPIEQIGITTAVINSYRMTLGDFQLDNMDASFIPWVAWFYFTLASLFVMIVLLNLLISIVGETFGRVKEASGNMMYQDMVDLIVENQFLIPESAQATLNTGKYILLAVPEDQDEQQEEIIQRSIQELKVQMTTIQSEMSERQKETNYQLDRILKAQKKLQDQLEAKSQ